MDIFVKSFNRPFLLDKCLASIKLFVQNFNGNIIIMDDGTPSKYLDKILNKYPEVKIVKSEFYDDKSYAIENDLEPEKNIPGVFWEKTISKGSDYFVLIEDDCWFCDFIDFADLENQMIENNLQLVKLFWLGNKKLISNNILKKTNLLFLTKTKLFTSNAFIFNLIYRKKTFKIDAILNRFGIEIENNLLKYYHFYTVAGAAFSKQYYKKAWKSTQNKVDELAQIEEVIKIPKNTLNVAHSKVELIRTSLKTTASKQNKEHLNTDFDVYSLNKILNEAWLNDLFEAFDFKNDITDAFIKNIILSTNLPSNTFILWQNWYRSLKQSYINFGCEINNDR